LPEVEALAVTIFPWIAIFDIRSTINDLEVVFRNNSWSLMFFNAIGFIGVATTSSIVQRGRATEDN